MTKLTKEEMKNVNGGLYGCIAVYDVWWAQIWHTGVKKPHWDYSMQIVKTGSRYMHIYGH